MMKRHASLILAGACVMLAIALVWNGHEHRATSSARFSADQIPVVYEDDLTLLDRPTGNLKFEQTPLEEVLLTLAGRTKTNIYVDWPVLNRMDVHQTLPVTSRLGDTSLGNALDLILSTLTNGAGREVGYYLADGIITITAAGEASRHPTTVYINIRPLVEEILAQYRDTALNVVRSVDRRSIPTLTRQEAIDLISKIVLDVDVPETWKESGGTIGSLREIGGILVITQLPANIRPIRAMLDHLYRSLLAGDIPPSIPPPDGAAATSADPTLAQTNTTDVGHNLAYFNVTPIIHELIVHRHVSGSNIDGPIVDAIEQIKEFVVSTIDTNSWNNNGGTDGAMHSIGGVLVIRQTPKNINAIRAALHDLKEAIVQGKDFAATQSAAPHN